MTTATPAPEPAHALRAFNRFYTRRIGMLSDEHKGGHKDGHKGRQKGSARTGARVPPFSLTEARVLWEVAQRPGMTAGTLAQGLGLNAGYISRLLAKLLAQGLLNVQRSALDARQKPLSLTAAGRRIFGALDRRTALAPLCPIWVPENKQLKLSN